MRSSQNVDDMLPHFETRFLMKPDEATIKASDWDAIAPDLIAQGVAKRQTNAQGDNFFDVWTADIVKDVMPVYSRIPAIAKMAARFPLAGNFVGFSAEIIRNSFNIVRQGSAEISFRATDDMIEQMGEKAAKRLEREINAIGAKRLRVMSRNCWWN